MNSIAHADISPAFAERNIPVALATDENYLPYLKVAINSAIANSPGSNLDIIVLHAGIPEDAILDFTAGYAGVGNASVRFVDISDELETSGLSDYRQTARLPLSSCYRLLLPRILPAYGKIVYIDVDVAVCRDLGELYETDVGDNWFAAAKDVVYTTKPEYVSWAGKWGFAEWDGYVNAGVLVMNLERFRREPVFDRLKEIVFEAAKWNCDQDALNFVCKGAIAPLDPRWNVQLGDYCLEKQIALTGEEKWIAHYTSLAKPWKLPARRYSHLWWRHAAEPDVLRLWAEAWGAALVQPVEGVPKVSIIIPVYNSARYLPEALASVLMQKDIPEIEVICIDDGSTDDSAAILDFWEKRDSRLKVLRQVNAGPGVARNAGIDAAKSEYIHFLDADDRLSSGAALREALEQAERDRLDVLLAKGSKMLENGTVEKRDVYFMDKIPLPDHVFAPVDAGANLYLATLMGPEGKLFRRKFLDEQDIRFPALKRSEDFPFIQLTLSLAHRIDVLPRSMFDHRIGVATSLESTKDETPLAFAEAERTFRKSLSKRGLLSQFERAANAASVVRFVYNLWAVRRYSNFSAILDGYYQELKQWICRAPVEMPAPYEGSLQTFNDIKADMDDDERVALFVNLKIKQREKEARNQKHPATVRSLDEKRDVLLGRVKELNAKVAKLLADRRQLIEERGALGPKVGAGPKVSFVVPVYNTGRFLAATLDSILLQTYGNIDVICCDDCSTDSSPQILAEYARKDPRVKIVTAEKNGGVSRARNLGMEHVTGDYIWFFDSDDLLHPQAVEIMLNACEANNADFAYTPVERIAEETTLADCAKPVACTVDRMACPTDPYRLHGNFYGVQHLLAKTALVGEIRFEPGVAYAEDVLFTYRFLVKNPHGVYIHAPLVYYRQRATSAVHSLGNTRIQNSTERVVECLKPLLTHEMPSETRTVLSKWLEAHKASGLPRPENESACYAVMASDEIRAKSTSGGVFTVLAEDILARGGCVAGAVYADDWSVKHALAETVEGLSAMRGSKYVRGVLDREFLSNLDKAVASGRPVLFTGLPCQVAAMRKRYGGRRNLVCVDMICHGAPDAKLWRKRVEELSAGGRKITRINFRDKRAGWGGASSMFAVGYEDGSEYAANLSKDPKDPYGAAFGGNFLLSDGCARCPFACEKRLGDITIGDFWDLDNSPVNDGKGLSCVVVNTLKGRELFARVHDRFAQVLPYPVSIVRQPNFHRPTRPHPFSREFQQAILAGTPFEAALAKYLKHPRSVALLNFHWEQTNFGALLTSFALSRYVADIGWRPQNIDYSPINADHVAMRANDGFESFRRRHLPRTRKFTDGRALCSLAKWFDTFIVGSDQVWAKRITGGREDAFFLSFAGPGKRLISAAASFGRVSASEWDAEELKTRLEVFSAISVREREDAQTVRRLVGKGECVPDPVFWVEPSVWHELADEACRKIDGAIAVYCVNRDETAGLLKFLELSGLTTPEKPARVLSSSLTPEEWLYAIRSAKLVVTDSFHGTCFSILFHTPFVCIHANEPRSVRHRTLLGNLGLSNYLFRDGESAFLSYRGGMAVDWAGVDGKISQYREQGRNFIAAALATDDMASPEMTAAWSRLKAYRKAHPCGQDRGLRAAAKRETATQTLARLSREPLPEAESPDISVVIPVYNAEKYIDDCLASLFAKDSSSGIEVICVDDGSTDGSLERLKCWANAAHNIRILEQKNQGPGVARNAGLDAAKGEYIFFLDADDRLSSGAALRQAYERGKADDLDVLVADGLVMDEQGVVEARKTYLRENLVPEGRVWGPEAFEAGLYLVSPMSPWAKLYRRSFLAENTLVFPALRRSEDFPFVQLALSLARRLGVMNLPLIERRVGVATSLESTKDETPLLFIDAERIFRKELDRRGLSGKCKDAANAAFSVRLAYNLRAVRTFASYKAIFDETRELFAAWTSCGDGMPEDCRKAKTYLDGVFGAHASDTDLMQRFTADCTARIRGEVRQRVEQLEREGNMLKSALQESQKSRGELFAKLQEAQRARGDLFTRLQESQKSRGELFAKLQESQKSRGELFAKLQESQKSRGELFTKLQEAQRSRGRLFTQLQEAQKSRGELAKKLQKEQADNKIARESQDRLIGEYKAVLERVNEVVKY